MDWESMGDEFDAEKIALEEAAKGLIIPLFRVLTEQGLSTQEAAAITAAIMSQSVPQAPKKPMED